MHALTIPDDAVKFIAFQRTDALRFTRTRTYAAVRRVLPRALYNACVAAEAALAGDRIKAFYVADIAREFDIIREHLPARPGALLDIGCGVAGIDALLFQHFGTPTLDVFLLDRTETDTSVYYGFKSRGAFYNSLDVAAHLLADNGVPPGSIHLLEATPDNAIALEGPLDLVISLISWGFHYPVETYLDRVHALLAPEGRMILDVRRDTGGLELLQSRFERVAVITEERKYQRICAYR